MEINGLANIHMIIEGAKDGEISPELAKKIKDQLVHLERYMIAYAELACPVVKRHLAPAIAWHEVRDNPDKYPTLHEKMNGGSK